MANIKIRRESSGVENIGEITIASDFENPSPSKTELHLLVFRHPWFFPAIYIATGIFFFVILFYLVDVYVLHLKVETAVVSTPMESMSAPISGYIKELLVSSGEHVNKGQTLVRIQNLELERDWQLAKIEVKDAELSVQYLKHLLENEQKKMTLYKLIGSNRIDSFKAELEYSRQEVEEAHNNLLRFQALMKKHYVSAADLDRARTKYKTALGKMRHASAQKDIENQSYNAIDKGIVFTGDKLEGQGSDIKAQITAAQMRLILAREKSVVFEKLNRNLDLSAPFDGKIIQIFKSVGNTTDTTKPLLLLIPDSMKKTVTAWLTQEEITHIRTKGDTKVYIPALGKFYHGKVIQINRTSGFIDEVNAQFRWRDLQVDRSATAVIEIISNDKIEFDHVVLAGMPAIVYFTRSRKLT